MSDSRISQDVTPELKGLQFWSTTIIYYQVSRSEEQQRQHWHQQAGQGAREVRGQRSHLIYLENTNECPSCTVIFSVCRYLEWKLNYSNNRNSRSSCYHHPGRHLLCRCEVKSRKRTQKKLNKILFLGTGSSERRKSVISSDLPTNRKQKNPLWSSLSIRSHTSSVTTLHISKQQHAIKSPTFRVPVTAEWGGSTSMTVGGIRIWGEVVWHHSSVMYCFHGKLKTCHNWPQSSSAIETYS